MRPHPSQAQIRPKISTMPRQKTEAAAYLDIYKLVNEKTRLQHELIALEERRDRIQSRLEVLNVEVDVLQQSAHQLRDAAQPEKGVGNQLKAPNGNQLKAPKVDQFNTLFLEY